MVLKNGLMQPIHEGHLKKAIKILAPQFKNSHFDNMSLEEILYVLDEEVCKLKNQLKESQAVKK